MLDKKSIAHLVTPYLFHTGSWVYNQLMGVTTFNQYIFTQRKENVKQFPFPNIVCIEDFNFFKIFINRLYLKFENNYGLFFTQQIKKNKIELVHAHMGFEACRWLKFAKKNKLPLITSFYGLDVSKLGRIDYWLKRYKYLFEYGNYFLAEGSYLKKQLINIGCPEEKIIIQKLGIPLNKYPQVEFKREKREIKILQVSSFREKKGIEYSLKAIAILIKNFKNLKFTLIGGWDTDEDKIKIVDLINKLDINQFVELLGPKTHEETINEMINSDIFLHPSVTAKDGDNEGGAPVSIIEASAVCLPIISTFHADIPEVVLDGKSGFLVQEKNYEIIADKILELIENPDQRKNFGLFGRKHIEKNYNLDNQIKNLENIYKSLLYEK